MTLPPRLNKLTVRSEAVRVMKLGFLVDQGPVRKWGSLDSAGVVTARGDDPGKDGVAGKGDR